MDSEKLIAELKRRTINTKELIIKADKLIKKMKAAKTANIILVKHLK